MKFLPGKRAVVFLVVAAMLGLMPLAASAALTYDFTINNPNLYLSPYLGPYASVHIDVTNGNAVFTVTGLTNSNLQYLLGDGSSFAANFSAPVTILDITAGDWTGGNDKTAFTSSTDFVGNGFQVSQFGKFNVTINNFDGYEAAVNSFTFTADPVGYDFTDAASVLANNSNIPAFFAASHIFVQGTNGTGGALVSGYAGNGNQTVVIPLPPSVLLLGSGLLGLGLLGLRRKKA